MADYMNNIVGDMQAMDWWLGNNRVYNQPAYQQPAYTLPANVPAYQAPTTASPFQPSQGFNFGSGGFSFGGGMGGGFGGGTPANHWLNAANKKSQQVKNNYGALTAKPMPGLLGG